MTSTPFVAARGGHVFVTDMNLSHEDLAETCAEWVAAEQVACEDFDARRLTHHAEVTGPAALAAADEVRQVAGLRLTPDMARALAARLLTHADQAERKAS